MVAATLDWAAREQLAAARRAPAAARLRGPVGLRAAALGGLRTPDEGRLSELWTDLVKGRAKAHCAWSGPKRSYGVVRLLGGDDRDRALSSPGPQPLSCLEAATLTRVLCGDQQKVVATDLGIAQSTASNHRAHALLKLGLVKGPVPVPFVLSAQSADGGIAIPYARRSRFEYEGAPYVVVSVPKARMFGPSSLTRSEREIVLCLIEGRTREEIAARRDTSTQTIACQLRAVFAKLASTGRNGAIRRGAELGWFAHI